MISGREKNRDQEDDAGSNKNKTTGHEEDKIVASCVIVEET